MISHITLFFLLLYTHVNSEVQHAKSNDNIETVGKLTANQLYPAIILEDYAELSSDSNEDAEVEESPTNSGLLEAQKRFSRNPYSWLNAKQKRVPRNPYSWFNSNIPVERGPYYPYRNWFVRKLRPFLASKRNPIEFVDF